MNDCIVVMGKKGLYDNVADSIAQCFSGTFTDVVFVDESEICSGSGIKGYIFASRYFPRVSGLFLKKFTKRYKVGDKKRKQFKESRIKRPVSAHEKCENVLYRFYPKAVVCLTPRTLALTLSAAATTGYKGCIIAGVYDISPSAGMSLKGADVYLTGTEECALLLKKKGIKSERIVVTGMPVRESSQSRESALKKLGLREEKPVVLIAGGRYCSGRAMDAAREFSAFSDRMQIVLSGGERGAAGVEKNCPSVIVAGEEDMDLLYKAADIAVIAPTAFIAAECMKNRIPLVLLPPVNGAQKAACRALKNLCAIAADNAEAVKAAMDILMDKTARDDMKTRGAEYVGECGEERLKAAVEDVLNRYKGREVFEGVELPESDDARSAKKDGDDALQEGETAGMQDGENAERTTQPGDTNAESDTPSDGSAAQTDCKDGSESNAEIPASGRKRKFKIFGKK